MRKFLTLFLILSLLLTAYGCGGQEENSCTFYYLRTADTIQYGSADALIAPVTLEISDQNARLDYLLQLYLDGPSKIGFHNPIPSGTYLLSTLWEDDVLVLVMSREFSALDNMQLTLVGACLTATCHSLAGAEKIQVRSIDHIYDFNLNDYIFTDNSTGE